MAEVEIYQTIETAALAEYKDRGSRFIAYSFPIDSSDQFKMKLEEVKKEHPKATHHCFAYRLGLDNNAFRVSDDGEPSGTAGRPILNQIDSKSLTNVLIVVVRYFGGTLLGVPGLINAYKSAASMVLQVTPVVTRQIEEVYLITFDYTQLNEIMLIVKQLNCTIIAKDFNLFSSITIGIARSKLTEAVYRFEDLRDVEVKKVNQ